MSRGDEAVFNFYRLTEQPFGVTPDPRFLYLGATHREALASLQHGISARRGFAALIARPGMGKTTLLWHLLENIQSTAETAFLFQSQSSPREFLKSLLADLDIAHDGQGLVEMHHALNQALATTVNKPLVIVVDEAQVLAEPTIELLRMLSNFETPREKLVQIILSGHPQLAETLAAPRLVQLRQRISILARLEPFNAEETRLYIDHRLRVAGYEFARPLFTESALDLIARHAEGIPRNINNVCFHALSLGCVNEQQTIDADVVQKVLANLDFKTVGRVCREVRQAEESTASLPSLPTPPRRRLLQGWPLRLGLSACVGLLVLFGWPLFTQHRHIAELFSPRNIQENHKSVAAPAAGTSIPDPPRTAVAPSIEKTSLPSPASQKSHSLAGIHPAGTRAVTVLPGQTLYRISVDNLGRYDDEVLAKICALNPELGDASQISVGQTLLLPVLERTPGANRASRGKHGTRVASKDLGSR